MKEGVKVGIETIAAWFRGINSMYTRNFANNQK
jgi:hypothetical protein